MRESVGYVMVLLGILGDLFGCVSLVRCPDVYTRLWTSTKRVALGTILLFVGVAVAGGRGPLAAKAIVCAAFILITSPLAAHRIAKRACASDVALWERTVVDRYEEEIQTEEPPSQDVRKSPSP